MVPGVVLVGTSLQVLPPAGRAAALPVLAFGGQGSLPLRLWGVPGRGEDQPLKRRCVSGHQCAHEQVAIHMVSSAGAGQFPVKATRIHCPLHHRSSYQIQTPMQPSHALCPCHRLWAGLKHTTALEIWGSGGGGFQACRSTRVLTMSEIAAQGPVLTIPDRTTMTRPRGGGDRELWF